MQTGNDCAKAHTLGALGTFNTWSCCDDFMGAKKSMGAYLRHRYLTIVRNTLSSRSPTTCAIIPTQSSPARVSELLPSAETLQPLKPVIGVLRVLRDMPALALRISCAFCILSVWARHMTRYPRRRHALSAEAFTSSRRTSSTSSTTMPYALCATSSAAALPSLSTMVSSASDLSSRPTDSAAPVVPALVAAQCNGVRRRSFWALTCAPCFNIGEVSRRRHPEPRY